MGAVQRALGFFVGTIAVYTGLKGLDSLLYDFDERCDFVNTVFMQRTPA
jgi:hypothetical protein